jgi:adenine-specific DNA glycosylase
MARLLDKDFKYFPACDTNVKRTFARIRREQEAEKKAEAEAEKQTAAVVRPIKKRTAA